MFNTIIKDCRQVSKETINVEVSRFTTAENQFMRPLPPSLPARIITAIQQNANYKIKLLAMQR